MDNRREKLGKLVAQARRFNIQLIEVLVRKNRENGGEEIIKEKENPRTRGREFLS